MSKTNYDKNTMLVVKIAILACHRALKQSLNGELLSAMEYFNHSMSDKEFLRYAIDAIGSDSKIALNFQRDYEYDFIRNNQNVLEKNPDFVSACKELFHMDDLLIEECDISSDNSISSEKLTEMAKNSIQKMIDKISLTTLEYIPKIILRNIGGNLKILWCKE
jgi:hypothetical protein